MYDQFYGLTGRPFQLTPDPHFYFESVTHRKAMSYLGYGLAQGEGFIVITGDIGAGKTTLVGHLMATIDPVRLTAVKIVSTQVGGDDMLRLAAQAFGIPTEGADKAILLGRIETFLHEQARSGLRSLLIVDEAQNLPISALEELRMLSNFQLGGQALLQIFLLGQPEFRDTLRSSSALEQLRQRVIATHHLEPMMANETEPYITHRLSLVGWSGNPKFTPDAFQAIHEATDGVPRRINALASRVLLLGAIDKLGVIDAAVVEAVTADMDQDEGRAEPTTRPATAASEEFAAPFDATAKISEPWMAPSQPVDATPDPVSPALRSLKQEVEQLRDAFEGPRSTAEDPADPRMAKVLDRVAAIEARLEEQEKAIRRVLTLMVDWVEGDRTDLDGLRGSKAA